MGRGDEVVVCSGGFWAVELVDEVSG
jgi:hypothetical protein